MLNNTPTISIVMPVYNGVHTILSAIESVQKQTYREWELLVIDDGSTDGLRDVLSSVNDPRVLFFQNGENKGIQYSLNRGLKEARGIYIARLDADDKWNDTEKLFLQSIFLNDHPEYQLVGTGAILVDKKGNELTRYIPPEEDKKIRRKLLSKSCFVHSSVLFRKEFYNVPHLYSEVIQVRHVEDHELWLRLGSQGFIGNIPRYSVTLTISNKSITAQHRIVQAWRMLKLSIMYRKKYPRFFIGIVVSLLRLLFFTSLSVFPISSRVLYRLQGSVREI